MTGFLREKRALLVGAGGLGCPAGRVLARSGIGHIAVVDDDVVDESNLHRQTLYQASDVGKPKTALFVERLRAEAAQTGHALDAVAREIRIFPENARELVADYDLVLDGTDNFASKFLIADACALARVPVVQAGAVRWVGWALGAIPGMGPCLRCVFEDVPVGRADSCAVAGVMGPVVGVVGALQAAIALQLLRGTLCAAGVLWSYDALRGTVRRRRVERQRHCPLCGGRITNTQVSRYVPPGCAA
jgi:molybdopterin/thiamine biosynthesis adenylyltransferase